MSIKNISLNRKAYHEYHVLQSVEAGLVLTGTEIKSIRAGRVNIRDAYAYPEANELWLHNAHIARYEPANRFNHDPLRQRKLLLHIDEIKELTEKVAEKGFTIVPLKLYLKDGLAKVELGLVKGKKLYDKRQTIAKRDAQREIERAASAQIKGRLR